MENYKIAIGDESLDTGIETIDREEVPDFKERFDQFIIRHVKGKLIQELIVRLENGFPTTEREAAAFDAQKEKNDNAAKANLSWKRKKPRNRSQMRRKPSRLRKRRTRRR